MDIDRLSKEQRKQENAYEFPYHHIPILKDTIFSQTKSLEWGYEYLSYIHFVLDIVTKQEFNSLLDIGCGDGRFLSELHKYFPEKLLVGLDYSQRSIDFAILMSPNVKYICGDIMNTNLFVEKFNIITSIETLEHIEPLYMERFLRGMHFYLKKEGLAILTVPSNNIEVEAKHYQHFDMESLRSILDPLFDVVKYYYVNRKSFFVDLFLKRLLYNRFFILNEKHLLRLAYSLYRSHFFHADKGNARRIVVMCRRKEPH